MRDSPLVSILINNYNYGHFLKDAIESALNQTYSNTEVIVVDDGSTDHSRQIIEPYSDCILPILKENGGQATAFNAGFLASRGEIICFLDSDDIFLPHKVAEVVRIFRSHPAIGWCFHRLQFVDQALKALPREQLISNPPGRMGIFNEGESQLCDFRTHLRQGKLPFDPPATSGLCFTRSLLGEILPMEPILKLNDDGYLKFSAVGLSQGFFLDPELALLRIHSSNAYTLRSGKQALVARNCMVNAHSLRRKFPEFSEYTSRLLARGVGTYWRAGGIPVEAQTVLRHYLGVVPLQEKLLVGLRILANLAYGYWSTWKPSLLLSPRRVSQKPL